jgi:Trp operon repressor
MTPLSRWKMAKDDEEQVEKVLVEQLSKVDDEKEMEAMLGVLLTDTERLMIGKRIFAFVLIDQGLSNTDIARQLHFTRATVERLRWSFVHQQQTNQPVTQLVKRMETSKILNQLLKYFLKYAIPALGGKIPK